jgi:hypothetical protein
VGKTKRRREKPTPTRVPKATELSGLIWRWWVGIKLQAERISVLPIGADEDAEVWFFAVALRNLLRAVELAQRSTGKPEIAAALEHFNSVVPDAKEVRDLLEHFDDYALGIGKKQRADARRAVDEAAVYVKSYSLTLGRTSGSDRITMHIGGFMLDSALAVQAADRLANETLNALYGGKWQTLI